MTLTVGHVTLFNPEKAERRPSKLELSGDYFGADLDATLITRDNLVAMMDQVVPVIWSDESSTDGYYRVMNADVSVATLNDEGMILWALELEHLGSAQDVIFRSILTTAVRSNDHGVTFAEAEPFHSPPGGHQVYSGTPGLVTRTSEDGAVVVWRDITLNRPTWSSGVSSYLNGSARVTVNGHRRAGLLAPGTFTDWTLENGLVRVSPNGTQGRIDVEHYDGAAWRTKVWRMEGAAGAEWSQWDWVSIIRNDPEECVVRLDNHNATGGRVTLDLRLRRGSRFVEGRLVRDSSGTLKVRLATAEAGTAITPTGATQAVAVRATSNDGQGDRYVVGSPLTTTKDLTNGGVEKATILALPFFIGAEVNGSSAQAGDLAADLCLQHLAAVAETTKVLRR